MDLLILAGGKGTRLGRKDIPKPMITLASKQILEFQLDLAKKYGLSNVYILSGYLGEAIVNYYGDGKKLGLNIRHITENIPLGTAGAVKQLKNILVERYMVFYGDVMMDLDLNSFIEYDKQKNGIATIAVHPNDHPYDSDLVGIQADNKVIDFHKNYRDSQPYYRNLVNAAVYILSPKIFEYIPENCQSDFGRDIFPGLIKRCEAVYAYNTAEYIKDIGTLERLKEVEADVISGKIKRLNREQKRRAIFMDRDGVLNVEKNGVKTVDELHLFPSVAKVIKKINVSEYLAVVITNQPIIAKGFISDVELDKIHAKLDTLLGDERSYIDRIYYCPHHPEKGFKGEIEEYKIVCSCRKPAIGMINQAVTDMNIDVSNSFIIGDTTVDVMTGINAGLKTILLRTGYGGDDAKFNCEPDFIFENIEEAGLFIIEKYDNLIERLKKVFSINLSSLVEKRLIVVSGLSRSGKTTIARVISFVLKDMGIESKILKLDNWLISNDERSGSMTVRERYKYKEIEDDLGKIYLGRTIKLNHYDAKNRTVIKGFSSFYLDKKEVLIVDGVVGLDIDFLIKNTNFRIYVEIPEEERKRRFYNFYRYKNLPESEIHNLYQQRKLDEVDLVIQTKRHADFVISEGLN